LPLLFPIFSITAPEYFSAKSSSYSCRKCASGAAEFYVKGDYFELSV